MSDLKYKILFQSLTTLAVFFCYGFFVPQAYAEVLINVDNPINGHIYELDNLTATGTIQFKYKKPDTSYMRFFIQTSNYTTSNIDICINSSGEIRHYSTGCNSGEIYTIKNNDYTNTLLIHWGSTNGALYINENFVTDISYQNDNGFSKIYVNDNTQTTGEIEYLIVSDEYNYNSPLIEKSVSNKSYIEMYTPCQADSRTQPYNECTKVWTPTAHVDIRAYIDTQDLPVKVEITTEHLNLDGTWAYEELATESYIYTTDGSKFIDEEYVLGLSTVSSTTYRTTVCVQDENGFNFYGTGNCAISVWGNGYTDEVFGEFLRDTGIGGYSTTTNPENITIWENNGCDDLNILDVGGGIKCSLIYLFVPSNKSVEKFKNITLSNTFPFSYAYDMGKVRDELFTSIQTATSTIDIHVSMVEGTTNTITIFSNDLLTSVPYSDTIRTILIWFIYIMLAELIYIRVIKSHDTITP